MLRLPLALLSAMGGMMICGRFGLCLPEASGGASGAVPKKMPTRATELLTAAGLPPVQKDLNLSGAETEDRGVAAAGKWRSHDHRRRWRRNYAYEAIRPASPRRDRETAKTVGGNS